MGKGPVDVSELDLESNYDALDKVSSLVQAISAQMQLSEDDETDLMISVMEAVNNAIEHGNKGRPGKQVHIRVEVSDGEVIVTVRDEGEGFDLSAVPDPTDGANLLKVSGRGILMMRSFMDEVIITPSSAGTRVRMTKRFSAGAA